VGVSPALKHGLVTVAGESLEDVADLPLAGRDPLAIGRLLHRGPGLGHRLSAQFIELLIEDFLVHETSCVKR
jgi:hypothetical protein